MSPDAERVQLVCVVLLALVAAAGALHWLQPVLVPLVLSFLLSFCFAPVIDLVSRRAGLPHVVALLAALLSAAALVAAVGSVVAFAAHEVSAKAKRYESYVATLSSKLQAAHAATRERFAYTLGQADFSFGTATVDFTQRFVSGAAECLSNTLLVLLFVVYLLEGRRQLAPNGLVHKIQQRFKRYLAIKAGLSLASGFLAWVTYVAVGVDLALVFALVHTLLNVIPSVGPLVATLVPLPVILVDPHANALTFVLALCVPLAAHVFLGHVVEPRLLGDSLELHPITVLLSLVFWSRVWGVAGVLLAVPMTAAVKLVFESAEVTKPLAQLLEGHFAEETI
jgi:AI-2 transport protein TqsA